MEGHCPYRLKTEFASLIDYIGIIGKKSYYFVAIKFYYLEFNYLFYSLQTISIVVSSVTIWHLGNPNSLLVSSFLFCICSLAL